MSTELRTGNFGTPVSTTAPTMLSQLTPEQMFDILAISVNGPRAWDLDLAMDVTFADLDANYRLTLRNGVLVYRKRPADPDIGGGDGDAGRQDAAAGGGHGRLELAGPGDHRRSRRRCRP